MKKVSKLLVMAVVVLAVITMSLNVKASSAQDTLINDIRSAHTINGMLFEIPNSQKNAVTEYIATLTDAQAQAAHNSITEIENMIAASGATSTSQISDSLKTEVLNKAKTAASNAGLTLNVNTNSKSYTLTKSNGETLVSGGYTALVTNPGTTTGSSSSSTASTTTTGSTLLYTGANYAVYAVVALAIVAVAIVVKKRA